MDKVEEKLSVEQGNKLIAKFMGGVYNPKWTSKIYPIPCENITFKISPTLHSTYNWTPKNLQYHSSWDWLMPVIKKLNGGRPHSAILWEDITKALIDCDIERTWLAVVRYINWFYKK